MKLSIITINYNNAEGLRKTLASVASQTYANIEHIIVDGGSTDGSVEIIREYADKQAKGERLKVKGMDECKVDSVKCNEMENSSADPNASTSYTLHPTPTESSTLYTLHLTPSAHIVRWISEPDNGIYNAMNKGIRMATGEYIQILNSGDILAADDVTERMMAALAAQCAEIKGDSLKIKGEETSETVTSASSLSPFASRLENCPAIFYGNMTKVNAASQVVGKSGYTEYSLRQFYSSTLNHDCAYIRKDLFEEYGLYDENLKIVSDWKWYLQAIGLGRVKPEYVDIDVTIFDDGGISETNLALRNAERRKVLEEVLPPAVLWDYDTHAFEMEQMKRLRRWKLYGLVYFMERVLFKLEKWFRL